MIAENEPALSETNGRDPKGKFATGNRISQGNPIARRTHAIRRELTKAVKPNDVREIVAALIMQAKGGDVAAAKEIFDRVLGRPSQAIAVQAQIDAQVAAERGPPAFFDPEYADYLRKKAMGEDSIRVEFVDDWYGSKAAKDAATKKTNA